MGQCGCGDMGLDRAMRIGKTRTVLAYDIYRGCDECFSGPGVTIYLFRDSKSEWLRDMKLGKPVQPDEYGGDAGHGVSFGLFEVDDLRAESLELCEEASIGPSDDDYASLNDWLEDFGLRLIQGAMRRFQERMRLGPHGTTETGATKTA